MLSKRRWPRWTTTATRERRDQYSRRDQARGCPGLADPPVKYETVRNAYRAAMLRDHPDHGGDPEKAARINLALAEVRKHYGMGLTR